MKKIQTILLEGILFLLPILVMIYLFRILIDIVRPVAALLPEKGIFGLGMTNLAALFILVILVIIAGFISRSRVGSIYSTIIENMFMKVIPGFSLIRKLFDSKDDPEEKSIKSALAYIDDAWLFAFILEEKNDAGLLTVFVPSAPIPTSGNVYLMKEEQVMRLDVPTKAIVKCITQLGIGSGEILKGKIKLQG
jgi:uncharacterized membrane protein